MRQLLVGVVALGLAGCTVSKTEVPGFAGPSAFAKDLTVTVTPDNITADGSQATVVATVVDASGSPMSGVPLQVTIEAGNVQVNYGTLSSRTIFTGSNGKATAMYAAPILSPFFYGGPPTVISVTVTPIGSNFETAVSQHATIKVTPPPVPPPTAGAPTASVTFAPVAPKVGQVIAFDASTSQAGTGHTIANYFWDFGDGLINDEHGSDASHAYTAAGRYTMVLGVVDELGRISSSFNTITVTQ